MITQYFTPTNGDALEISNFSTLSYPDDWLTASLTGGQTSDAGVSVNGYTALQWCPLWQGVNIIAGDLGQVPFHLIRDEFTPERNHRVWYLLNKRPNALQTPSVFVETMVQWSIIWGNAVAYLSRDAGGVRDIIPLRPDCIRYEMIGFDARQQIKYYYYSPINDTEYELGPDEVLHIQGLSSDGIWGYPLWQVAKNCIGGGKALEKHGNKQFANGAQPSGVLQHPGKLGAEAVANLRRDWNSTHGGPDNAGKIAILWEGMQFNPISHSNIDSQWAEAKKLSYVDAACLLNLPAYKLNVQDSMGTKSNLEEQNETYKQMTLTRPANRFAQECERKLLPVSQWQSDRWKIVPQWHVFMQPDIETKMNVADRLTKATILNPNEARRMFFSLPPRPGGDVYGNPATTPGPEDGQNEPDNGRPPGAKTENADNSKQIRYRLTDLLQRERAAMKSAAKHEKNFVAWLDDFYGNDGQLGLIGQIFDVVMSKTSHFKLKKLQVAAVRKRFVAWAANRKTDLLELCETATAATLADEIGRLNDVVTLNYDCDSILGDANGSENH